MIVTYNSVSNQLWITADFIDDVIAGETGMTVSIDIVVNAGTTVNIPITIGIIDVPNNRLEIDPADINLTEFINGVYSFKLTKKYTNGSKEFNSYCLFIDIDFTCTMIDKIASSVNDQNKVIYILGLFNILNKINECEECNCSNALVLWNEINYSLDLQIKQNDCGCN